METGDETFVLPNAPMRTVGSESGALRRDLAAWRRQNRPETEQGLELVCTAHLVGVPGTGHCLVSQRRVCSQ